MPVIYYFRCTFLLKGSAFDILLPNTFVPTAKSDRNAIETRGGYDMNQKTKRRNVTIALMVATFLAAIEGTIVSTAMPTIVSDLGGIKLISWVFAAYLLTSAITTPIYGKLADLYGRKIIFTIGTTIFLIGSMMSGAAHTMTELICFRALQGIGAGAVLPTTFTIIGDIYSFEERAKIQGLFSAIWGISGILGPLAGGSLVDNISWRWIFYFNLPFGIASIIMIWIFLQENFEKKKKHIDYLGAITFTIGMASLLYAFISAGSIYPWNSWKIIGLLVIAAIALIAFIWIEAKSPEPMLPLKLFRIREISVSNLASFLISVILIGITTYLPMWMQGIFGVGATNSGLTLTPMSIGWPIGATIAGRLMLKLGSRNTSTMGLVFLIIGSTGLAMATIHTPHWFFVAAMLAVGFGFGFSMTSFTVSVQSAVGWNMRGAATASNTFVRTLGQTVGVAILGTLFNNSIASYMTSHASGANNIDMNKLLNPETARHIPESMLLMMRKGLISGLHSIYLVLLFVAAAGLIVVFFLPKKQQQIQKKAS